MIELDEKAFQEIKKHLSGRGIDCEDLLHAQSQYGVISAQLRGVERHLEENVLNPNLKVSKLLAEMHKGLTASKVFLAQRITELEAEQSEEESFSPEGGPATAESDEPRPIVIR